MRPDFGSLAVGPGSAVRLPEALLLRARDRRLRQQQALARAKERQQHLLALVEEALSRVFRELTQGRLTCLDEATPAVLALDSGQPLAAPSRKQPGPLTVAFDYRPTTPGRLHSRLARCVAEDPAFLADAEALLRRALRERGYLARFHTHLVQRWVPLGDGGYHATVRVQVLLTLSRATAPRRGRH